MLHTFLCYKAPSVSTQILVLNEVQWKLANRCPPRIAVPPCILYPFKALTSVFPTVMHPRFISFGLPKSCVHQNKISVSISSGIVHKIYHCIVYVTASIPIGCIHYWHTQLHVSKAVKSKFLMVVHPRSMSLLAYPVAVYTSSFISFVYPAVVFTRSILLIAYSTTPNILQCMQSSKQYILNGC